MKKLLSVAFLVVLLTFAAIAASSMADVVDVPASVLAIEQEAFYGDTIYMPPK